MLDRLFFGNIVRLWYKVEQSGMWYGEYSHSLDDKDRFILPAKFRHRIKQYKIDTFFLTRGLEECIFMLASREWKEMEEKFKNLSFTKKQSRFFNRLYFSGAYEVNVDPQGRILLPNSLKEFAGIKKEIVIAGVADRIEIWDRQKWQKFYRENKQKFEEIAEDIFE